MKKINVMIVDDSALIRHLLTAILTQSPEIGNVDSASDPLFALRKMEKSWPDVIVLDIEMPRMNGIEFSRKLMRERPTPIVIVSSQTEKNMALGIEALKNGALELIHKPETGLKDFLENSAHELVQAIKAAAASKVAASATGTKTAAPQVEKPTAPQRSAGAKAIDPIVIGASTGGTVALEAILTAVDFAHGPIVVVQHMPSGFTKAFAARLNNLCSSNIYEAADGQILENNSVYIAPGGFQTEIIPAAGALQIRVRDGELVNRHKPSVDVLFDSAAKLARPPVLAILLTGMGADGAQGLLTLHRRGTATVAQNAETCVVFGMPAEAIRLGAARKVLPLDQIYEEIRAASPA